MKRGAVSNAYWRFSQYEEALISVIDAKALLRRERGEVGMEKSDHLQAAIDALNQAHIQSYKVEQVLRWALSILAEQRKGDPPMSEIDLRLITGLRAMSAMQAGIGKAISQFRVYRTGGLNGS